jgi:stage III sporulation protein AD
MEAAKIGGLIIVGLTALLILKQYKPEWAVFLRLAVTVVALSLILTVAGGILSYLRELTEGTGAQAGDSWEILLKALGVAFLTETAASICRDSGETGLAGWVEMAGKLELLLLSFPLIRTVLDTAVSLLS